MQQEAALCDTVRLVAELLRHHLVEIMQFALLQNFCVQLRHTVDGKAARDRQVGHADLAVVQDRHAGDASFVARIFGTDLFHKAAVDLVHDLVHARKQPLEQLDRPFFQRLGHDRMVRIGTGFGHDLPGLVPLQFLFIQKQTHQLGHGQRRMCIIHMEDCFFIQLPDILVSAFVAGDRRLQARGNEEILLAQAQLLAGQIVVIRIQDTGQCAGQVFLLDRFLIVTLVERIQLEVLDGFRIPDTQGVHNAVAVSDDRQIIRHGTDGTVVDLAEMIPAGLFIIIHFNIAAEADLLGIFRALQLERIAAVQQPAVRLLDLHPVFDALLEHAVVVTDAAAVRRVPQSRERIQEAGCQTAQAAVPERRIALLILDRVQIDAKFFKRFLHFFICSQCQQVVAQVSSCQEFHGHVVNDLRVLLLHGFLCLHPVVDDLILDDVADRLIDLPRCGFFQCCTEKILNLLPQSLLEYLPFDDRVLHTFPVPFFLLSSRLLSGNFQKIP